MFATYQQPGRETMLDMIEEYFSLFSQVRSQVWQLTTVMSELIIGSHVDDEEILF